MTKSYKLKQSARPRYKTLCSVSAKHDYDYVNVRFKAAQSVLY